MASESEYRALHEHFRQIPFPQIDHFVDQMGCEIDTVFMHELALHTQTVIKRSDLNWQHGRILYAVLRNQIDATHATQERRIFETGTARGFSALCLARALVDSGASGCVVTVDRLPHHKPMMWNCIDDHDGPKTREQLLEPWMEERDRCIFITGESDSVLPQLGLSRIHFAFLDGAHTKRAVLNEYEFVATRQEPGDVIVLDDVTPKLFPGVCAAVDEIAARGLYDVHRIQSSIDRGYAVLRRVIV